MNGSTPRIMVFVPAYRCEKQIARVIDQFDESVQKRLDTVMVVDNRSPDNTLHVAIEAGRRKISHCRFIVWINDANYGLGGSHKVAFRYAVEQGFDYMVVLHGDDQADVHDILPELADPAFGGYDCHLGARFMRGSRLHGYSRLRTVGNRVYNMLFTLVVWRRVSDLGSGLNAYRIDAFRDFYYRSYPDDLTFNYAMLLGSCHRRQRIRFFPISWREEDQVSNVRLFRQAFKVLGLLGRYLVGRDRLAAAEMRGQRHESYTGRIVYESGARH